MSFELESAFQCLLTASEEDFAETARQLGKDEQRKLLHRLLDASLPPDSEASTQPAQPAGQQPGTGARKRSKTKGKMGDRKSDDPDSQPGKGSQPKGSQTDSQPGKGSQTDSQPWWWNSQPYYSQSWWWSQTGSQTGSQHSEEVSQDGLIHIRQRTGGRGKYVPSQKVHFCIIACMACRKEACNKRMDSQTDGHWPHFCRGCKPPGAADPIRVPP